jgi:hypothetical protein
MNGNRTWVRSLLALASLIGPCWARAEALDAAVVRLEIHDRRPFAKGETFGAVGAYEAIRGRLRLEADPEDPANARIADLKLAPRDDRGRVAYWSNFFMLKPVDPLRGNRRILYDVTNRGNLLSLWTFNEGERSNDPRTAAHAGNGFLMRRGYTLLWSGWNGDVLEDGTDRLLVGLPIALEDGRPVRRVIHLEISVDTPERSRTFGWSPWGVAAAYPTVDLDDPDAKLVMRPHREAEGVEVPRDRWSFARWEDGRTVADPRSIYVRDGLRPGWLYDLTYTAEGPRVAGLGMAAIRDAVSFFRYETADGRGEPNPLADMVDHAYLFGISQSGRLVNHFIYEGFNTDTEGRVVFEGAIAHVAGAGRGLFNQRFGLATLYSTQHRDRLAGSDTFPFATVPQRDPVTGEEGDILARAREAGYVPKLFFVQSSTEYWSRGASLLHTDVAGEEDLPIDPSVRIYLIAGSGHLGAQPPTPGIGRTPRNPLRHRGPVLRALLVALDRWVTEGREPPESRHPRIGDGTLVSVERFREAFPDIPGVEKPGARYQPFRLDFGARWNEGIADKAPPVAGEPYRALVPMVDDDGNELGGIRLPDVAAPLATFTGWSLRAEAHGAEGMLADLDGSYLRFPHTSEEQAEASDPRPAVLDRYPGRGAYLRRVVEAAMGLEREGYLLAEDALELIRAAAERDLWP